MTALYFLVTRNVDRQIPGAPFLPIYSYIQMGRAMTSETTSSDAGAADDGSAIDARVQAVQG